MNVSVVIPNLNGLHFLKDCLPALSKQTYYSFETILVDNASKDGSVSYVKENYPSVKIVQNECNRGFSGAVNAGISASHGKYVILLNNDTIAEPDFVEKLVTAMEKNQKAFSGSACMLKMNEPEKVDDAGDLYTVLGLAFQYGNQKPATNYRKPHRIFSACAGAAIYRREVFDEIGLFDESFFAYREDLDIGYRARLFGYENIYVPKARVLHFGSGTTGTQCNDFKVRYGTRNLVYLNYKNMPLPFLLLNLPFLISGFFIKGIYYADKGFLNTYLRALYEGLTTLRRVKKTPFSMERLKAYLAVEMELFRGLFVAFFTER